MAGPAQVDAARERVLAEHREVLEATLDAADAVAAESDALSEGRTLRRRLRERLAARDLLACYPAVLGTAVAAAGRDLAADPVPAPPHVVVTSTGPLLRGSTSDGRLLVTVRTFAVRTDSNIGGDIGIRYRRTGASAADTLDITLV